MAKGLALWLNKRKAVQQAGYSPMTAEKKSYAIVRRPLVQSALTEVLEHHVRSRSPARRRRARREDDGSHNGGNPQNEPA